MNITEPLNVWIVEGDAGYRRNLRISLGLEQDIVVSHVFPSCAELFEAISLEVLPDIVLLDLGPSGTGGAEAVQELLQRVPEITLIILTVYNEKEKVQAALDAGAAGYVIKGSDGPEIVERLRRALERVRERGSVIA